MKCPSLVERQIAGFLRETIRQEGVTMVVPVERKGTAILRSVMERDDELRLGLSWKQVASSCAIERLPDETLQGKVVLVFDDMLHTGHHVYEEVIPQLQKKGGYSRLVVAAFAVHRDCPVERHPPHYFYSSLSQEAYERVRLAIVGMLQRRGSLLLDTEHIEVRASVHCAMRQFFEAFASCGQVACFSSAGGRINATVDMSSSEGGGWSSSLPQGADARNAVRKCRIVERPDGEFAIIPICFASTPAATTDWPESQRERNVLDREPMAERGLFYAAGLVSAVSLLREVLGSVTALGSHRVTVYGPNMPGEVNDAVPRHDSGATPGYTLEHLLAMYPGLDVRELTKWIWDVCGKPGIHKKEKPVGARALIDVTPADLSQWAIELAQTVRSTLDQDGPGEELKGTGFPPHPAGVSFGRLIQMGESLWGESRPVPRLRASLALDRLIDEAYFVTHAEPSFDGNAVSRFGRTFEPDGEVVSSLIRQYTALRGLPARARRCLMAS